MSCNLCQADLDHCHDILVVHLDGSARCSDPFCSGEADLHEWQASELSISA